MGRDSDPRRIRGGGSPGRGVRLLEARGGARRPSGDTFLEARS